MFHYTDHCLWLFTSCTFQYVPHYEKSLGYTKYYYFYHMLSIRSEILMTTN